jgi:hypothetical protein
LEHGKSHTHATAKQRSLKHKLHSAAARMHSTAGAASHTQKHKTNDDENDAATQAPREYSRDTRARVLQSSCNNEARTYNITSALRSDVCSKRARKRPLSQRALTHTNTHPRTCEHAGKRRHTRESCQSRTSSAVSNVYMTARSVRRARAALLHHSIIICWHYLLQRM